ncbi:MAG: prolipoprotein diacylglyceryl transferase, partial [Candidatus Aadella gelida]|nr:prolipoprotein diacylglyceryl transferase [Candidatus Aadella gelida]
MHRILFEIGPITIYSYGFFLAVAFIVSSLLILKDTRQQSLDTGKMMDCVGIILLSGILGGRLLFVGINWKEYVAEPLRIFMFHEGGLAFQGALVGAILGGIVAAKVKKMPFWKSADIIAPYIALGQAIGRIGCFFNGCCYGKVADTGIRIVFPHQAVARMPAQLYSSFMLFLVFVALLLVKKRKRFDGYVFSAYLVLYGSMRFIVDFFRADNPEIFFSLKLSQILSL